MKPLMVFEVTNMCNHFWTCHISSRYYPALRTLEQLEESCLPQAGSYRFCGIMSENIPRLRTHIRDVSMSDLKDFLESIRKHSDKIGETAMKQVCVLLCEREREWALMSEKCLKVYQNYCLTAVSCARIWPDGHNWVSTRGLWGKDRVLVLR